MDIIVVDNSAAVDENLQSVLSDIPEIRVVGHSMNAQDAIEQIDALLPDAVILDLLLQSGSGMDVLENIKKRHAWIKVMVLTHYSEKFYLERCKRAGVDCFLDKSFQFMQLHDVLEEWVHPGHP